MTWTTTPHRDIIADLPLEEAHDYLLHVLEANVRIQSRSPLLHRLIPERMADRWPPQLQRLFAHLIFNNAQITQEQLERNFVPSSHNPHAAGQVLINKLRVGLTPLSLTIARLSPELVYKLQPKESHNA